MEITDLSSLNWVHDGEIIDDIYRGMIDYDSITEAQAETILARWRATRAGTTGTLEQGGHEMTVIGQVGLTTIIVGVRDGEGGGEAVIVDLPAEEVRGPRSLYSIEGRMKVEDITLDDTQVELALRLAEQHMKP